MTYDITSLLRDTRRNSSRFDSIPYRNSRNAEQALQIMQDIKTEKIKFKVTTEGQAQVSAAFSQLAYWYERNKNTYPFPEYLANRIIAAYDTALFFGMKDNDEEKINLKKELELKDQKIVDLTKQLEQARKELEDFQDKDTPTFKTPIEEDFDQSF